MTPQEKAVVDAFRLHFDMIHDHLDELLRACGDDDVMKRQLGDAMQEALDNFIEAQNRILGQAQAVIQQTQRAADDATAQIQAALKNLQNIKATLDILTKVVKTMSAVVAALPSL